MKHHLTALLFATTTLAGCQQVASLSETDTNALLSSMEGPEITGVDATMLKEAKRAESQGDFNSASQTYQQLLDKNPKNVGLGISYAESLRRTGKAGQALQVFNKILKEAPDNQDALEGKGLSELSLADIDAATATLTKVAEINPNRWRTLNGIGILFATKGLYEDSQQYFNKALLVRPNHPAIINNKGLVQALDRQFYPAISSLLEASEVATSPMHKVQADLNAALVYAIAGDLDNAETMAKKHLEGSTLQNNLGLYALLAKDNDLARTHLHMALSESTVFYEKAWDNLNNIQAGKQANTSGKDNSKRIQFPTSNVSSNAAPNLPQPDSATPPQANFSASQTNPTLNTQPFASPKDDASVAAKDSSTSHNAVAAPVAVVPEEAVKDDTSMVDKANEQKSIINSAVETSTTSAADDSVANAPSKQDDASNAQTQTIESDSQKSSNSVLNFEFLSKLKPKESSASESVVNVEKKAASSNINLSTKSSAPLNMEAKTGDFKEEKDTITEISATEADKATASDSAKSTPEGVSEDKYEPSNGNAETSSKKDETASKATPAPRNGFESLESFITNW